MEGNVDIEELMIGVGTVEVIMIRDIYKEQGKLKWKILKFSNNIR